MRSDSPARPAAPVGATAGPSDTRAAALRRLALVTPPSPGPLTPESLSTGHPAASPPPWSVPDPDGDRPDRIPPAEPDLAAWADPPWWRRIRWTPDRLAGIALVVLVLGLGAFSVHRLLSTVPEAAPVPQLPLATPGVTGSTADPASAPAGAADTPPQNGTPTAVAAGQAEEDVVVAVVGMVGRSGLVTLPAGSRVADALDHAGGILDGGDRDGLNLARKVVDGEQILVGVAPGPDGPRGPRSGIVGPGSDGPQNGAPSPGAPSSAGDAGASPAAPGPVDLNSADAAALDELPGVGPVTASAILAWRAANGSFTNVDQLAEVDGIGPATLAKLRPLVTV